MGARDKGGREAKKPKKDAKKISLGSSAAPPPNVELIRKKRKPAEE